MLPSLVAQEIKEGIRQYLITGFEPSNATFKGIVREYVDTPGNLGKGPYLSIGLPFRQGTLGLDYFPGFETGYKPFLHQEIAWRRLRSDLNPASTLVATGTGSGKTECFLYPLLQHGLSEHLAGRRQGIKALVIYPMNALASDQARRFAEAIQGSNNLRGRLRVGLYVGEGEGGAPGADAMGPQSVITAKEALRNDPPDILLTNYKMLDYLLIRPTDRALWCYNSPDTLRYLVVDELHTFDGAQGTDLALLIRRLKARLKVPERTLVCVGTSATLGDTAQAAGLVAYAQDIFGEPFAAEAVLGEDRLTMAEFIGDALIEHQFWPDDAIERCLDSHTYASIEAAIAGWYTLFFPEESAADPTDPHWRALLGDKLKRQLQFNNLLRLLARQPRSLEDLAHELPRFLPPPAKPYPDRILDALLALVAWARDPQEPKLPFVQLRLQLWLREQRRMLVRLTSRDGERQLISAYDLKPGQSEIFLPLVQCSDCRTSAWLTRLPAGSQTIDRELRTLYETFFSHQPELALLYPASDVASGLVRGESLHVCGVCGQVQAAAERCQSCGASDLVAVFRPLLARAVNTRETSRVVADHRCPVCGGEDTLLLFGARSTSLSAVAIQHLWSSSANDHRQLIAFSDSVQDAAHRAGFFAARTYANNVRMAIVQALTAKREPRVPWASFLTGLPEYWLDRTSNPRALTPEQFVVEFIGPNMHWLAEYEALCDTGKLDGDRLLDAVGKRLQWEALAEFGYQSRRGRSVERTGCAALGIAPERVAQAIEQSAPQLQEGLGLRDFADDELRWFVWGLLLHLKHRGAIAHELTRTYIEQGGRSYLLGRLPFMPGFGPHSPRPVFFSAAARHPEFDTVVKGNRTTWYQHWLKKALAPRMLLPTGIEPEVYLTLRQALLAAGVLLAYDTCDGQVVALNPEALFLESAVARLATADGGAELVVPASLAPLLEGMPALDLSLPGHYVRVAAPSHWLAWLYRHGAIRRVITAEHTGLLERPERESLEARFKANTTAPWNENLLSATPTLEMGVDIGQLSAVLLCSVPPSQANYLQRSGRAGRRDGNALALVVAAGRPHDLYFYARPEEMMAGPVQPPGVFLNASAVLFRQLTAFCLDAWVATGIDQAAIPVTLGPVLDAVERFDPARFPYNFIEFVQAQSQPLFEGFCRLLAGAITERTRDTLEAFLFGGDDIDSLRVRLVKRLGAMVAERKALSGRAKTLKNEIDKLRRAPQDEATLVRREEAQRERDAILDIIRKLNARHLLNVLTDEGLIPNYAFPEEGVSLRSVLWRRRDHSEPGESRYDHWVVEYERGASAALTELAPYNRFFAGKRRVEIDQIDLTLSPLEIWRLCPSCSHADNVEQGDRYSACPRCGDPQWADIGQRRLLVRLRHVLATTEDRKARFGDEADDRDPRFYNRQLLPDFLKDDVQIAYRLASTALPFGFEFIRRVTFRDINFGQFTAVGEMSRVGGREAVRKGFPICRHCGKVQHPLAGHRDGGEEPQAHAYDCPVRDRAGPEAIVDCLYLYREFQSEALRLLLPVTWTETDSRVLPSLMAALRLGLKLQFGGKVDHLAMLSYEEPDRVSHTTRHYLLLYDTVPGGTGYLHELLRDAGRLFEIFRLARDQMAGCGCTQDESLDGCYRCLFAYRADLSTISRRVAVELLSAILAAQNRLEPVETLSDILINPSFESALEARLIEAFQRTAATDPTVRIQQEVIRGRPGYYLRIGINEYTLEPQVELGPLEGVAVSSRPDFLIRPARAANPGLPMAIFTDGFAFHQDKITEDSLKRLALVQSGRYWIWSLTWQDLNEVITSAAGTLPPFPGSGSAGAARLVDKAAAVLDVTGWLPKLVQSPFRQLVEWLRQPDEKFWSAAVFVRALTWVKPGVATPEVYATADWLERWSPSPIREVLQAMGPALCGEARLGEDAASILLRWLLPASAFQALQHQTTRDIVAVALFDPPVAVDQEALRLVWWRFLALGNLLQFLPFGLALTAAGVSAGLYEQVGWARLKQPGITEPPSSAAWSSILEEVVAEAAAGLRALMDRGLPVPVVGFEWQDESGAIVADAELAWIEARLAVLRSDQADSAAAFQAHGWRVILLAEGWHNSIEPHLQEAH